MKRAVWIGDSLERVREFPAHARREAGYQLERVQAGEDPADWKPMPSVGLGVNELRVRAAGAFRVIYSQTSSGKEGSNERETETYAG